MTSLGSDRAPFPPFDEDLHGFGDPAALMLCLRRKAFRFIREGYLPASVRGRELVVACLPECYSDPGFHAGVRARYPQFRLAFAEVTFKQLRALTERACRPALLSDAQSLLARKMPHYSLSRLSARAVGGWLSGALMFLYAFFVTAGPDVFFAFFYLTGYALFLISIGVKYTMWHIGRPLACAEIRAAKDADPPPLPDAVYSVLSPMFREPECARKALESFAALNYPHALLDVVFVLEEGDAETLAALHQDGPLPVWADVVVVPKGRPQTKPRACNYALPLLRGTYVVVFDAEDVPDPDQLRMAAVALARSDHRIAAFQARLQFYNADENFLTMCFALEYAAHFGAMLRGLQALSCPMLLGGTGNHFRTQDLSRLGAWDPYNVTEDADLGLRLYLSRRKVMMLPSVIQEEATLSVGAWIKQRTRWVKGHMLTSALHCRYPLRAAARTGAARYAAGHMFITVPVLVYLLAPLMLLFGVLNYVVFKVDGEPWFAFPPARLLTGAFLLFVGYCTQFHIAYEEACRMRQEGGPRFGLLPLAASPLYYILHCYASWRALLQSCRDPFVWEKTTHGVSKKEAAGSPPPSAL